MDFTDPQTLIGIGSVAGSVLTPLALVVVWWLNELFKRREKNRKRQEQRYTALLESVSGYYTDDFSENKRQEFTKQWRIAWLYCPDRVIRKVNGFLNAVGKEPEPLSNTGLALFELMLQLRKQRFWFTRLNQKDFRLYGSKADK